MNVTCRFCFLVIHISEKNIGKSWKCSACGSVAVIEPPPQLKAALSRKVKPSPKIVEPDADEPKLLESEPLQIMVRTLNATPCILPNGSSNRNKYWARIVAISIAFIVSFLFIVNMMIMFSKKEQVITKTESAKSASKPEKPYYDYVNLEPLHKKISILVTRHFKDQEDHSRVLFGGSRDLFLMKDQNNIRLANTITRVANQRANTIKEVSIMLTKKEKEDIINMSEEVVKDKSVSEQTRKEISDTIRKMNYDLTLRNWWPLLLESANKYIYIPD